MDAREIYTNSILTFAFTNDGRMIVRKDKEGKIDTLPWIFIGGREKNNKTDYEDSIWVMNNMDEYKERIATFFVYHLRNSRNYILRGFFKANGNHFLDAGELHDKIAHHQIEEMKSGINSPSYIRVNRGLYDSGTNSNGQPIIKRVETRYVVFPSDEGIELFPDLEAKKIEEIRGNLSLLSDKILLGITGEGGRIMDRFTDQLNSSSKSVPRKM